MMVENSRGEYLGRVDPRHAQRLVRLMEGGNQYSAAVVSSTEDMVTVIIREIYQHPSQAGSSPSRRRGWRSSGPMSAIKLLKLEAGI